MCPNEHKYPEIQQNGAQNFLKILMVALCVSLT